MESGRTTAVRQQQLTTKEGIYEEAYGIGVSHGFCPGGKRFAADTVKIGVFLPLTGQMAYGGQLELDGLQMAHKEAPKILGKNVELFVVDNKSDKVEAANAVKRLIEKEKVVAIIGTYGSSLAMAGGEVSEKAGIPQLGTSCTNPLVTQGKKYIFRMCFIDPFQGAGAATYAYKKMKAKNAAVLIDVANDYSRRAWQTSSRSPLRSWVASRGEVELQLRRPGFHGAADGDHQQEA